MPAHRDHMERLSDKGIKSRTAKDSNAAIDELAKKYGEDAVDAIQEVVDRTKFEEVRTHGLKVIRDLKSEDTKY